MLRDRIVREVTRSPATIDELAGRLGVSRAVVNGALSDLCWINKVVAPRAVDARLYARAWLEKWLKDGRNRLA